MLIAADYPFLDVFWTIIIFFAWVVWIWMIVVIFTDVFRRTDIGGWSKAAWVVFMIVVPFIGVLCYLIAQHDGIAQRNAQQQQAIQKQFDDRVREVATSEGPSAEIEKAAKLRDAGTITGQEFEALKAKALAAH
jgi:type VI protein secretion system component VasK